MAIIDVWWGVSDHPLIKLSKRKFVNKLLCNLKKIFMLFKMFFFKNLRKQKSLGTSWKSYLFSDNLGFEPLEIHSNYY